MSLPPARRAGAQVVPPPSKIAPVSMDRNVATAPAPQVSGGDTRTDGYTYFTKVSDLTDVLYTSDRLWAKITLTLETAGPVAVGIRNNLIPVLRGNGVLLDTGVPMSWILAKSNKLYIASTSINRVKVLIEPLPWLEQISALISDVITAIVSLPSRLRK